MKSEGAITPSAKVHTPAFVIPLGKSMYYAELDSSNKDDARVVSDFRAVQELFPVGTPERTYYNTLLANALMVKNGIRAKSDRRNAQLKDMDHIRDEIQDGDERRDKLWEKLSGGLELICIGGISWSTFYFITSMPAIEHLIHEAHEGYAGIALTLGLVLIWSAIRSRFNQHRYFVLSGYYRRMAGHIWRMYRESVKREYNHALNSVNIAWKQMTGEDSPDAEIARQMIETLMREVSDYDQIYEDGKEAGLVETLFSLLMPRTRGGRKPASSRVAKPTEVAR